MNIEFFMGIGTGIFIGLLGKGIYDSYQCEHDYEKVSKLTHTNPKTNNQIGTTEYYKCKKCLNIKSVLIGEKTYCE